MRRLVRWAVVSGGVVALASAGAGSQTFTTASPSFVFTVPLLVCSLRIDAVGASGGSAGNGSAPAGTGGKVLATVAVQPGQQLNIVLGHQGGSAVIANPPGTGGA